MATGVNVGTASVSITANAQPAVQSVARTFNAGMPGVGKDAGKHLGGGIFAAASKFAGPLAALFAVDKIVSFGKDSVAEARDSQKVNALTTQVIKTTGGAAKVTAGQIGDLATAISNKTGVDDEAIQAGENLLLTFTNVRNEAGKGNDIFNQATQTVTDMSAALGQSGKSSAIQLGKALNDPIKGVTALQRVGVSFTADQKKQIKTLVDHGKTLQAQKLILGELNKEFGGSAAAAATNGEKLATSFGNFKEQIGTALLPILDKVQGFLTAKIIPALSTFVTFLSENAGPAISKVQQFLAPFVASLGGLSTQGAPATGFLRGQLIPALLGIVGAGQRLAAVVLPIIRQIAAEFAQRWPVIKPIVVGIFKIIGGIVTDVMAIVQHQITFVTAIVRIIWSKWGKQITAMTGTAFQAALTIIRGVMNIIGGIVKVITGVMTGDWRKAGDGIKQIVRGLFQVLLTLFQQNPLVQAARIVLRNLRDRFAEGVTAIGKAWDGLKEKAKAPIRFVVDTVINNGLIDNFNKIAKAVGISSLPRLSLPAGFHDGGYTGKVDPRKVAGVVHGDEQVIKSKSRRSIESQAPGFLDYLNSFGRIPGYASGGLVGGPGRFTEQFAKRLLIAQKLYGHQFSIYQRGFRPRTSYSGTSHAGDAVDLGPATATVVKILRSLSIAAWRRGPGFPGGFAFRHIHGVPLPGAGHAGGSGVWQAQNYLHGGDGLGGKDYESRGGVLGKIGAFLKAGFSSFIDWFKNLIKAPLSKLEQLGDSPFAKLAAGVPHLVAEGMASKLKGYAGGTSHAAPGWAMVGEHGPELVRFGGGERVASNGDSGRMLRGVHIGSINGPDPRQVIREMVLELDRHAALNPTFAA